MSFRMLSCFCQLNFPSRFTGAQETVVHFERLNSSIENREDYFRPVSWTLTMKGKEELLAYVTDTLNGENTHVLKNPTQEVIKSLS